MKHVTFSKERCKSCGICVSVCPKKIIGISDSKMNSKGFRPAEIIDETKCIGCAFCAAVCPDAAVTITADQPERSQ